MTMYDLDKKIDEYSDELFSDLGVVSLSEEKKADIYARVEEHFHRVIVATLTPVLNREQLRQVTDALDQEDYRMLGKILKKYPQHIEELENKIDEEMQSLKLIITEEEKNATMGSLSGTKTGDTEAQA